jgi:hypothetical protein
MNNYSNNPERVKELLLADTNVNTTGKKGYTPLLKKAKDKYLEIVNMLLERRL